MLEHQKKILSNLSYDHSRFAKELEKSIKWLDSLELLQLYIWVKKEFGSTHYLVIRQVFGQVAA